MANFAYTLSRHRWADDCFVPPDGAVATIDLRSLIDCGTAGVEREAVFCAMPVGMSLDDSHHVLGQGDLRDLRLSALERSIWESVTGYAPQGETLNDWLADHLLNGADPLGLDACKPLIPTVAGELELHLGGHSRVWVQPFRFGQHSHTNAVQAVLQADFRAIFEQDNGRTDHPLKVLDYWCDKYRIDKRQKAAWQQLVPADLRRHVAGPVRHETSISDDFTGANGTTIGNLLTWTEDNGLWERVSNQVTITGGGSTCHAHPTTALSSSDNYGQVDIIVQGTSTNTSDRVSGGTCRWSDSSNFYFSGLVNSAGSTVVRLFKRVAGVSTQLGTDASVSVSLPQAAKTQANGSTIDAYWAGASVKSASDTALSSGTSCGMWIRFSADPPTVDNFAAADLAVGGSSPSSSPSTSVSSSPSTSASSSPSTSASSSPSSSPSTSPSASASSTPSASASSSPSTSASSSPSTSVSSSPSASASATPSASASSSPSTSPSTSASATPSASVSSSPSASPSPSASASSSPSTSPSGEAATITIESNVFTRLEGGVNVDSNRLLQFQMTNAANRTFTFEETGVR